MEGNLENECEGAIYCTVFVRTELAHYDGDKTFIPQLSIAQLCFGKNSTFMVSARGILGLSFYTNKEVIETEVPIHNGRYKTQCVVKYAFT